MITDKDCYDCSDALVEWFKSQRCDPADGTLVMCRTIATQLAAKTTDVDKLQHALKNVYTILCIEIALQIKDK